METSLLKHAGGWVLINLPVQDDEENIETQLNMHMA